MVPVGLSFNFKYEINYNSTRFILTGIRSQSHLIEWESFTRSRESRGLRSRGWKSKTQGGSVLYPIEHVIVESFDALSITYSYFLRFEENSWRYELERVGIVNQLRSLLSLSFRPIYFKGKRHGCWCTKLKCEGLLNYKRT